eukprot:Skav214832  [mRNA]  locus=scaffold1772:249133:249851:- [translate_table: standard]
MRSISDCDKRPFSFVIGLVRGTDVQNAVGVNVVGDLDLWHAARGWGNAVQVKLAQQVVVLGHGTLSLEDLDQDTRLIVGVGGEPPAVSRPIDKGVTSNRSRSWTAEEPSPVRIAACTAAP